MRGCSFEHFTVDVGGAAQALRSSEQHNDSTARTVTAPYTYN